MKNTRPLRSLIYTIFFVTIFSCGQANLRPEFIKLQGGTFDRLTDLVLDSGKFNRDTRSIEYMSPDSMNTLSLHLGQHQETMTIWSRIAGHDPRGISYLPLITDKPEQNDTIRLIVDGLIGRDNK